METNTEIVMLSTKEVYRNRWMRVREDAIRRADGSEGIYGVVEKPDFAVVVAIEGGEMVLVEQYRYAVGERMWEFPQGSKEEGSIVPEDLARAELREETGLVAGSMEKIGELCTAIGYSNQKYSVFYAKGLMQGERELENEEQGLISRFFPIAEVERMILSGVIRDATTVAAFGLLKMKGIV